MRFSACFSEVLATPGLMRGEAGGADTPGPITREMVTSPSLIAREAVASPGPITQVVVALHPEQHSSAKSSPNLDGTSTEALLNRKA